MDLLFESQKPETPLVPTYEQLLKRVAELESLLTRALERIRQLEEENKILKKKLYGSSSERRKGRDGSPGSRSSNGNNNKQTRIRSLKEQYPNAEVEDQYVDFSEPPQCECCHKGMTDSGLEEVTEQLHTIPAWQKIVRQHRRKYKCTRCFGGLLTALLPPRIAPGSSLGDSFIIEAAIAKFYYLVPAERYALMVAQSGLHEFPPQLVLRAQHYLSEFLKPVYHLFKKANKSSQLLFADETPHRMLEGNEENKSWYLWGFSAVDICYFEIHDTRSGEVAIKFLAASSCTFLMSDVYTGYARAIREVNVIRRTQGRPEIISLYCNSRSRRKFVEAATAYPEEAEYFISRYEIIYCLEAELRLLEDPRSRLEKRAEMKPFFDAMMNMGDSMRGHYSDKSSLLKAVDYFANNYDGLTRFLEDPDLPTDNNLSERHLRSPVVGRKTWYGTHSERGAETAEVLFTVMQSCKHLKVDPRNYLKALTSSMLAGSAPFTPGQYLDSLPDKRAA